MLKKIFFLSLALLDVTILCMEQLSKRGLMLGNLMHVKREKNELDITGLLPIQQALILEYLDIWELEPKASKHMNAFGGELLAVSEDSSTIAITGKSHPVTIFDNNFYVKKVIPSGEGYVHAIALSPNGKYFARGFSACSYHQELSKPVLELYDTHTSDLIQPIPDHKTSINTIKFSPDNNYVASSSADTHLILATKNWKPIAQIKLEKMCDTRITDIAYNLPEIIFLTYYSYNSVSLCTFNVYNKTITTINLPEYNRWRYAIKAAPTLEFFILGKQGELEFIDMKSKETISRISLAHMLSQSPDCLAFSPDGKYLAMGTYRSAAIWHVEAKKLIREFTQKNRQKWGIHVEGIAFKDNGRYLLVLTKESLRIYKNQALEIRESSN